MVPDYTKYGLDDYLKSHVEEVNKLLATYIGHMEATKLRDGLRTVMFISAYASSVLSIF